jgi:hypothetical protein
MKKAILLIVLVAAGYLCWHFLKDSPEEIIRKRLRNVAQTASFAAEESPLMRLANAQRLSTFCTLDVEVTVDTPRGDQRTMTGRDEILQAAGGVRSALKGLSIEFLDMEVVLGADKTSAVVNLTARASIPNDRDDYIQELRLTLRKTDGEWLISKVETVKTFSYRSHDSGSTRALIRC